MNTSAARDTRDDALLIRAMNASLLIGILLLGMKTWAAAITGSAAIYSDAAESVVHVLAVIFASYSLRLSRKPADENHHYGHEKAAFLSAGFEGAMIAAAACMILYEGIDQLLAGPTIRQTGLGIALTSAAAIINAVLGFILIKRGRKQHSLILEANGKHVLTDVWTSLGVFAGLMLVLFTGNPIWDPLAAILVALNILWTGWGLVRQSFDGLMDAADPAVEKMLREILQEETSKRGLDFHQLRYRHTGRTHWVELHLVFPDGTTVEAAHTAATGIEAALNAKLEPAARIITHLEPNSAATLNEQWEA